MITSCPVIAFNLLFIEKGPLTGPGYYAAQLFEYALREAGDAEVFAYVQKGSVHHFSDRAQKAIKFLPSFRGRITRVLFEQLALPFMSRRDNVALLFSPAFVSPLWGAPIKVATICDMYYAVVPDAVEYWQRIYWRAFIPATVRVCDHILTISENSKADILRITPRAHGKVTSIPLASRLSRDSNVTANSLDVNRGQGGTGHSQTATFLMVANLTSNKNPSIVAAALSKLSKQGVNATLIHIGKDHLNLLADAAKHFGVEEYIIQLGKVSDDELKLAYAHTTAVIVSSLYEGFGMPAVEAQAMGAPLICSNRSALPEAAGLGALFFDPTSVASLAERMVEIIVMPPESRQKLINRATANARSMSWERTARETLSVFRLLLDKQT